MTSKDKEQLKIITNLIYMRMIGQSLPTLTNKTINKWYSQLLKIIAELPAEED